MKKLIMIMFITLLIFGNIFSKTQIFTGNVHRNDSQLQQATLDDSRQIEKKQRFFQDRERISSELSTLKAMNAPSDATISAVNIVTQYNSQIKNDGSGGCIVFGAIKNTGSSYANFIKIYVEISDVYGNVIGTDYSYAHGGSNVKLSATGLFTNALYTNEIGYYQVYVDASYSQAYSYSLYVDYETYTCTKTNASLSISSGPYTSNFLGYLELDGTIKNSSTKYLTYFTCVYFCILASDNYVEDVDFTYVDGSSYNYGSGTTDTALTPGASGDFDIFFLYCPYSYASSYLNSFEFFEVQTGSVEKPTISLSRTSLNYGASGSYKTDSQSLTVSNTGKGTLNWTSTTSSNRITVSPSSGTNTTPITVSLDPTDLEAGTYSGTITISDSNATNSPQTIDILVTVYAQSSSPQGEFATPAAGASLNGSIPVTGWAVDDVGIQNVKIYVDQYGSHLYIGDAIFIEGARPDVAAVFPTYPLNYKAGWGYMLLSHFLPGGGNGTYTLIAKATDLEGHEVTLGSSTFTCDNANMTTPFGALDTPLQGGTASGKSFINWGWVLTPQPNTIATSGSTIKVYVDGVVIGSPKYNIYRSDIAEYFPGYNNSNGAAGYYSIDTTKYDNGIHSIFWVATDNGGNAGGIGSRFFSIENTSSSSSNAALYIPEDFDQLPEDNSPVNYSIGFDEENKDNFVIQSTGMERNESIKLAEYGTEIEIKELKRVVIDLPGVVSGAMLMNGKPAALPIGSTLESRTGKFYWNPGPGFLGNYDLVFVVNKNGNQVKKSIKINILPL